jgi:hypothetical protein
LISRLVLSVRALDRTVESCDAVDRDDPQRLRVTHPFHPWAGQELEFVKGAQDWRVDRGYLPGAEGELTALPAEWTDVVAPDPFVVIVAGWSPFRTEDALALAEFGVAGRSCH